MPVFSMPEPGRIAAYCPVLCGGTLAITFIHAIDGPEVIIDSILGLGCCDRGCTAEQIRGALFG